jgi:hypothetical protein
MDQEVASRYIGDRDRILMDIQTDMQSDKRVSMLASRAGSRQVSLRPQGSHTD